MAYYNNLVLPAQLAEQHTNMTWALNPGAYDLPMFASYDLDAESDRAHSPPSLLADRSPASSTSPLALDSSPVTPPSSEVGLPRIEDHEPMIPFCRDDGMHIDHVPSAPVEPAFTLDSLGMYGHVVPSERGELTIKSKVGPRTTGPERTTKTTKRARLNSVTNQSTKGTTRRGKKAKAKAESAPARVFCEDCGHSYKSAVMLREHATFALTHDDLKTDDELQPVRWVCPRHGTPYTVPTSLQRHLSGHDACETALAAWCQRVGITRGQYLSLNYNKDFCSMIKFKPRTDPKWRRRLEVTQRRGGMKNNADPVA